MLQSTRGHATRTLPEPQKSAHDPSPPLCCKLPTAEPFAPFVAPSVGPMDFLICEAGKQHAAICPRQA